MVCNVHVLLEAMSSSAGKSFFDLRTPEHDPLRLDRGDAIDALEVLCVGALPIPRKAPVMVIEDEPSTVRNLE